MSPARWVGARRDDRRLTRSLLYHRGWKVLDQPTGDFDVVLVATDASLEAARRWLHSSGRVVLWHDPALDSRSVLALPASRERLLDPLVAHVCVATQEDACDLPSGRWTATGDPALDLRAEGPGAAARARAALGLDPSLPTYAIAVGEETATTQDWRDAIAALRVCAQIVLLPSVGLSLSSAWPREWTGPGFSVAAPGASLRWSLALAAAQPLLVGGDPRLAWLRRWPGAALGLGRSAAWSEAGRVACDEASRLAVRLGDLPSLQAPDGVDHTDAASKIARIVRRHAEEIPSPRQLSRVG